MPRGEPFVTQLAWEDSGLVLMARLEKYDASNLAQADVASITLKVFKVDDQSEVATATLTVADVIFNTLQTGGPWTKDSEGYNFKYQTLAAHLPDGDECYRFEFKLTPASGAAIHFVFEVPTADLWGS